MIINIDTVTFISFAILLPPLLVVDFIFYVIINNTVPTAKISFIIFEIVFILCTIVDISIITIFIYNYIQHRRARNDYIELNTNSI